MSDRPALDDAIPRPAGFSTPAARLDPVRQEVAATAARLIAESGLDYASAKRKAVQVLFATGSVPRGGVPDTAEIDAALREHLDLFDDDHPARVRRMREAALSLMAVLADCRPYLTGGVWKGIVAEHAPIHLQAFVDDAKDVQIGLLNRGLRVEVGEAPHFRGNDMRPTVEALAFEWQGEPVVLSLYPRDDLRGALKGVPAERGDAAAVERLLAGHAGVRS